MNLARLSGIRAGEAGRQGRQGIGAERLEGAGDGGRTGKSSPPEGPGETARGEELGKSSREISTGLEN